MLLLALIHALAQSPQPQVQARATVRIHRATPVNAAEWARAPTAAKRVVTVRDDQCRTLELRLIEHP